MLPLQRCDSTVEVNKGIYIVENQRIFLWVRQFAFPANDFKYFLHVHTRGNGYGRRDVTGVSDPCNSDTQEYRWVLIR